MIMSYSWMSFISKVQQDIFSTNMCHNGIDDVLGKNHKTDMELQTATYSMQVRMWDILQEYTMVLSLAPAKDHLQP